MARFCGLRSMKKSENTGTAAPASAAGLTAFRPKAEGSKGDTARNSGKLLKTLFDCTRPPPPLPETLALVVASGAEEKLFFAVTLVAVGPSLTAKNSLLASAL